MDYVERMATDGLYAKSEMLYHCCCCHVFMYHFHQRHYSCLTFAVCYQRNILKDVKNRNGIKAAMIKFFFNSGSVKLSSKNAMFVIGREK